MPDQRIWRKRSPQHVALGRVVRTLRHYAGLSQEELAYRTNLGRGYIGVIERGETNMTFRTLLRLAEGLEVPLWRLFAYYDGVERLERMPLLGIGEETSDG